MTAAMRPLSENSSKICRASDCQRALGSPHAQSPTPRAQHHARHAHAEETLTLTSGLKVLSLAYLLAMLTPISLTGGSAREAELLNGAALARATRALVEGARREEERRRAREAGRRASIVVRGEKGECGVDECEWSE